MNAPAYEDTDSEDSGQSLDDEAADQRDETVHDELGIVPVVPPGTEDAR